MPETTYYFFMPDKEPLNLYRSVRDDKGLHMYTWQRLNPVWLPAHPDSRIFKWFYNGDLDYERVSREVAEKYFPEAFKELPDETSEPTA